MATAKKRGDGEAISRLAARGESALAKLADLPGGSKALKAFNELRERVDDLGKKVRGIEELERRVAKLEKELAALKRAQKPKPAPRKTTRKSTTPTP